MHGVITSWGATSVLSVIHAEMAPYFESDPPRIVLEGVNALIAPNDALSLGLLIHELFTNAAKFGALSNAAGRVSLRWAPSGADHLWFDWQETGGPPPPQDRKRGFGSDLIEKVLSRELHSAIKIEFAPSGAQVGFRVPVRIRFRGGPAQFLDDPRERGRIAEQRVVTDSGELDVVRAVQP